MPLIQTFSSSRPPKLQLIRLPFDRGSAPNSRSCGVNGTLKKKRPLVDAIALTKGSKRTTLPCNPDQLRHNLVDSDIEII